MKKIVLVLGVIFISASSFNISPGEDCDQLALDWYNQSLDGGYSQQDATNAYGLVLESCYLDGGDSDFEVQL